MAACRGSSYEIVSANPKRIRRLSFRCLSLCLSFLPRLLGSRRHGRHQGFVKRWVLGTRLPPWLWASWGPCPQRRGQIGISRHTNNFRLWQIAAYRDLLLAGSRRGCARRLLRRRRAQLELFGFFSREASVCIRTRCSPFVHSPRWKRPAGSCGSIGWWRARWRRRPRAFVWPFPLEAPSEASRCYEHHHWPSDVRCRGHGSGHVQETALVAKLAMPFSMEPARST